jgi:hypothetical protein
MIGQLQIPLQTLEHCQSVTITEPLKPGPDRRSVTGSISMRPATPRHATRMPPRPPPAPSSHVVPRLRYAYPLEMMPGVRAKSSRHHAT